MDCVGNQLILLGMLWLKFLLFHESSEVRKDVFINGRRVGVRTVQLKECMKATEMKAEQRSGICTKSA